MCLSDLTLQTPKGQNPFKMGPQNSLKQPLRHYKIRYLRAFRFYFCPNRSYSTQPFRTPFEVLLRIGPEGPKIGPKML